MHPASFSFHLWGLVSERKRIILFKCPINLEGYIRVKQFQMWTAVHFFNLYIWLVEQLLWLKCFVVVVLNCAMFQINVIDPVSGGWGASFLKNSLTQGVEDRSQKVCSHLEGISELGGDSLCEAKGHSLGSFFFKIQLLILCISCSFSGDLCGWFCPNVTVLVDWA